LILRDPSLSGERPLSTRRQLLLRTLGTGAALVAGSALAACARQSEAASVLPAPETTTIRIVTPPECDPGIWLAQDYLREEGFTDVSYVNTNFTVRGWLKDGLADIAPAHPEFLVAAIDAGLPLTVLAPLHSSCLELWVDPSVGTIRDLRGRRISVRVGDMSDQFFAFFAALLGYSGMDPLKDVHFVEAGIDNYAGMINAFKERRVEAVLAGGAEGPRLRRLKTLGNVILDTMTDKPWSQYECCHLVANRDWARQNPVAAKRATRAVINATTSAAPDHARAAHDSVAMGFPKEESLVKAAMDMCRYNWRDVEPTETVRWFALRLAEANVIKSTPQQIIDRGTDFAFLRQLRSQL
jgi:NitT/TauT family transport system substrate-binding protein